MLKTGIMNILLRGLTVAGRFLLLLSIARFLSPEAMGIWGLVNVTITISLYFLGLDFYTFNTREILAQDDLHRTPMIRDQIVFHGLIYIIFLPLLLIVFLVGLLSWKYALWFYLLLMLEHLSQESTRLLTTLSRPTMANAVLFLRSGAWVLAVMAMMLAAPATRTLPVIWTGWAVGVASSLALAGYALRKLPWESSRDIAVDWAWIRRGMKVALPFFCATMSFEVIQYADRYFLQHFWGDALLGVYTFYAGIANVIHTFIFAGIIMILYPRIIAAYQQGDLSAYRALLRRMGIGIVGGLAGLSAIALLLIKPVLQVVNKQLYVEQFPVFGVMLVMTALLTVSYLPHYVLFVRRRDMAIIGSTLAGLVTAIGANALLVPSYGLMGAAGATLAAIAVMLTGKTWATMKTRDEQAAEKNNARPVAPKTILVEPTRKDP